METFVDLSFAIDIVVNFCSTYVELDTGNIVADRTKIAKNYVCGSRFIVDVLASVPFDLIFNLFLTAEEMADGGDFQRFQQLTGLLKLVRLLRLGRIVTFMKMRQDFKLGFRIFSLVSILLMIIHWLGACWFILIEDNSVFEWLPPYDLNWQVTKFYSFVAADQYISMFYYGLIMLIGNEIAPVKFGQYWFAGLTTLLGSLFMMFLFGSIAATVQSMN
jgi:hypothetical protein